MLKILPLKSVREDDKDLFQLTTIKLANLYHHGFPVIESLVITPPREEIKKILTDLKIDNLQSFEQKETNLKTKIFLLPPFTELESLDKEYNLHTSKVWKELMTKWFSQLKSMIYRQGVTSDLGLFEQLICFADNITVSGKAYLNPVTKRVMIEEHLGGLSAEQSVLLDALIKSAQQKLYITFVFHFVVDNNALKFIRLSPFTQPVDLAKEHIGEQSSEVIPTELKTALKIFSEKNVSESSHVDGFIISDSFDLYAETALTNPTKPVLFVLPNTNKKYLELFLDARNKKRLLNTQLVLPSVLNIAEMVQIKKELGSKGVFRKGTLKMWLQIKSPENILNIEEYLKLEFDGVIFDLDSLQDSLKTEEHFTLEKFIDSAILSIHKFNLPIIVRGKLSMHDDLLSSLIKKGIFGVGLNENSLNGTREYISMKERQLLYHFS